GASPAAPPAEPRPAVATPTAVVTDSDGFRLALPPYEFAFPMDHAAHPSFRTEWWYYTGHLRAGERSFGYELTFFRVGLPVAAAGKGGSAWRARQVLFRHLALTDEKRGRFLSDDRAERQALDLAGADSTRYLVWIGDDYAGLEADRQTHRLVGNAGAFALDLELTPEKPPVVHGEGGVSQKTEGAGNASHYYSFTRLATRGRLVLGKDTLAVDGRSWMDHEFGSARLKQTHTGWDWFSVQLSDGRDLMLYRLRRQGGGLEPHSSGTLVDAAGHARHIRYTEFDTGPTGEWVSPRTGGHYPSGWIVRLPGLALDLRLTPTLADQELVVSSMGGLAYWEGSVRVTGTSAGKAVTGQGYVELTGYAGKSPF
ncbi:MAG TPA: lipocalin-like domain-containing protein, partial [Candidatus Eisenbacteria bacterium]